jgi:hypothetical protein
MISLKSTREFNAVVIRLLSKQIHNVRGAALVVQLKALTSP